MSSASRRASPAGGEILPQRPVGANVSRWCFSRGRRALDVAVALLVVVPALPLMLLIAVAVRVSSPGRVMFRHRRLGRDGEPFDMLKFRTMYDRRYQPGIALTRFGDPRVTRVGRLLRRWKLDELPQFINVLKGEMALVGLRPDSPEYLCCLPPRELAVVALTPGITGAATLAYRHEEQLLATVPPDELESFYVKTLLPRKVRLELEYARTASLSSDLGMLLRTVAAVFQ